jgi:hypothetical protein
VPDPHSTLAGRGQSNAFYLPAFAGADNHEQSMTTRQLLPIGLVLPFVLAASACTETIVYGKGDVACHVDLFLNDARTQVDSTLTLCVFVNAERK